MGLMILKCPHCGQSNLIKENEHYRCPVCESIIFNDDYKTYQETVEKLIQEGKEADIGELRNSFNEELQQEHLDVSQLKNICNDIKRIISDDKIANYFIRFLDRNRYPGNYELYLQELAKEKLGNYEQKIIIPVMVDKCKRREVELVNEVLKVNGLLNEENKDKIEEALVHRKEEKNLYDSEKKVFICHSHKDIKKVKEIAKKLERNHISCWYSERNLPWDIENYWVGIYKAIEKCEVFLFILSEDALDSDDVIKEINKANELGKKIRVEYKIDESENDVIAVRRFFDGIQWIDGSRSNQYDELVEKIYNYLERSSKVNQPKETINKQVEVKPANQNNIKPKEVYVSPKKVTQPVVKKKKEPNLFFVWFRKLLPIKKTAIILLLASVFFFGSYFFIWHEMFDIKIIMVSMGIISALLISMFVIPNHQQTLTKKGILAIFISYGLILFSAVFFVMWMDVYLPSPVSWLLGMLAGIIVSILYAILIRFDFKLRSKSTDVALLVSELVHLTLMIVMLFITWSWSLMLLITLGLIYLALVVFSFIEGMEFLGIISNILMVGISLLVVYILYPFFHPALPWLISILGCMLIALIHNIILYNKAEEEAVVISYIVCLIISILLLIVMLAILWSWIYMIFIAVAVGFILVPVIISILDEII